MKKKILGVFSVILVLTLCIFVYNPKEVSAGVTDNTCKQVDAYLYFSDQQWVSTLEKAMGNGDSYTYETCSTSEGMDTSGACKGTGTFNIDFSGLNISDKATIEAVEGSGKVIPIGDLTDFWTTMTTFDEGTTVKNGALYVRHGAWSNKDLSNQNSKNGIFTVPELSKASLSGISTVTDYTFKKVNKNLQGTFKAKRIYKKADVNNMKTNGNVVYRKNDAGKFIDANNNVVDANSDAREAIIYAPMLYKMTFNICDEPEVKNPTLTIRYWYDEVGGKTAAPTYSKEEKAGNKYDVTSPSINGYSPDKDVVRGTMPDEDVIVDVIYTPKTGAAAMGFIWFIGLGALGYGIYYYNRTTREQEEL